MKKYYFSNMPCCEMNYIMRWNKPFRAYLLSFCEDFGINPDSWSAEEEVMDELDEMGKLDGLYVYEDEYREKIMTDHGYKFTDDYDTLCERYYVQIHKEGTEQTW